MRDKKEKPGAEIDVTAVPLALAGLEPTDVPVDVVSVLLFESGGERFGVAVEHTEGVVDCPRITPLPSAPDGMIGVTSVRGRMTLVMDLSLKANPDEGKRRLILLKGESQLGLVAERVEGVLALEPDRIRKRKANDKSATRTAQEWWVASEQFKHEGFDVPLLDAARLTEI
jgi:chemotaxis signal transduction protein